MTLPKTIVTATGFMRHYLEPDGFSTVCGIDGNRAFPVTESEARWPLCPKCRGWREERSMCPWCGRPGENDGCSAYCYSMLKANPSVVVASEEEVTGGQ